MPRLRDTVKPMTRLLWSYEVNGASLANALKCAPKTARTKIENPDKLTLGDLTIIHRRFGIPVDDMRRCVC